MIRATTLLLRHAPHDTVDEVLCGRMPGVSLGEAGRRRSLALAAQLARDPPRALYTSPVERARQTAEILAVRLGLTPIVQDGLTEIEFGGWTGQRFAALRDDPLWSRWNSARAGTRPPAGESMAEAQRRALAAIDRIRGAHPDGRVALVSHGDVIKAMLMAWLSMPLDAHAAFDIAPASVSTALLWDGGARVLGINGTTQ